MTDHGAKAMTAQNRHRFTTEQVLRGIQAFVTDLCGPDIVIDADNSVLDYMEAAQDSHGCALWFLSDLARYFQLRWGDFRWVVWLKLNRNRKLSKRARSAEWERWKLEVAPTITVRHLATHIARHAPAFCFDPVNVLGQRCHPAGIFCGIIQLPEIGARHVGPSTALREIKSKKRLRGLWQRAEWISGIALPKLNLPSPNRWPTLVGWGLIVFWGLWGVSLYVHAAILMKNVDGFFRFCFPVALLVTVCSPIIAVIGDIADRMRDPLPREVRTFGDLAKLIAKQTETA